MSLVIPAREFRVYSNLEILNTIEVALRVLKSRNLRKNERTLLTVILKDVVEILAD